MANLLTGCIHILIVRPMVLTRGVSGVLQNTCHAILYLNDFTVTQQKINWKPFSGRSQRNKML